MMSTTNAKTTHIGVFSGKGGVGKTTISASLAVLLKELGKKIIAVDTDVDAPNLSILFQNSQSPNPSHKDAQVITVQTTQKAKLNESKCIHCMECITDEFCTFNAIKWNETKQIPIIDPIACEGCNGCSLLCDAKAFEIFPVDSGTITKIESDYGFSVITGETILGAQTSGKLVTELKKYASDIISEEGAEIVLYDGPPGIGCPVIASLAELDYVIVIIEPTGAALHDAQRLIEVVENFKIPYGVILNKADIWNEGAQKIQEYLDKNQIELLGKIPLIKDWPYSVAKRIPIVKYGDEHNHYSVRYFKTIVDKIVKDIIQ